MFFSFSTTHTKGFVKIRHEYLLNLGYKVVIVEDKLGFILYHEVIEKQTDDKVAVLVVKEVKKNFETFSTCSSDKGFYTKENKKELNKILKDVIMPKKGRCHKATNRLDL